MGKALEEISMTNTILQQLESKKSEIRKEILNHDLFKMNRDDAIKFLISRFETSMFLSRGKLFSFFKTEGIYRDSEKIVRIIQKSLPFIFHNLVETSQVDGKKIEVRDLILLLQRISDYLEFEDFIQLYKIQVVNVVFQNRTIRFEYKRDEYKINDIYNGYWHMLEQQSAIAGATKLQDITDKIFDLTVDLNINNFTLEDYKKFCKGIDHIIEIEYLKPIMVTNKIGYIELEKSEWVAKLSQVIPELCDEKINHIIDFLIYNFKSLDSDPILSYFIPVKGKLILSVSLFNTQRLDKNILKLLSIKNHSFYQNEQKKLELHQINELKSMKSDIYDFDIDKNGSPGEDLIVYDKRANIVHAIELKFKLPVDSVNDIRNLKKLLSKGAAQNKNAMKNLTVENVFDKYFDHKYSGIRPNKILFFTLTNYSVDYFSDSFILLTQHYKQLLKKDSCSYKLEDILNDKYRGLNLVPKVKFKKINLFGNIIKIPIYYAEVSRQNL